MKKTYIIICTVLLNVAFAQISMENISNLNNQQINDIKDSLKSEAKNNTKNENINNISTPISIEPPSTNLDDKQYFGYNYFTKKISFFDNIPTPVDYKLGPGDEVILSMWGENNFRKKMTLNKDGMIFFENIGFINLSNKTLESAEELLDEELSRIYSTLNSEDNSTSIMLELSKLKSINVYFSGHVQNPGINLIHPFSDIFSAIVQAGGINDKGSLRDVQLIRNDQLLTTVDFYSFFMNGKNTFSNVKLIDGDVIHIPNVKKRVSISGQVNRPSTYELLSDESLSDIITYASGFASNASSTIILNQIIPVEKRLSDDNARTKIALNFKNSHSKALNNGDHVEVLSITNVDLNVEVYGRVKSPGVYPAKNNSLKYILDIAGGFDDPVYRQTIRENEITILRRDSNEFYSIELNTSYNEADKLQLLPNDKIFVYEDINYRTSYTYRVEGEVNKPGTFPFSRGISILEALERAEGLTSLSSMNNVFVFKEYTELNENDESITTIQKVGSISPKYEIGANDVIVALPYENVVRVEGNVYNPGLIALSKGLTISRAIEQAGGYMPYSIKKGVYVTRADGEIDKVSFFRGRFKRLNPGDIIVVPVDPSPSDFDITTFLADISTTLANIAAILVIADNQNN